MNHCNFSLIKQGLISADSQGEKNEAKMFFSDSKIYFLPPFVEVLACSQLDQSFFKQTKNKQKTKV